jgi:lipoprotein-releasing system ATP-binding protein
VTTLRLTAVTTAIGQGDTQVEVLRGVDLELAAGEALAITGPSGSGKSTLLHIIGTLEAPTSGSVEVDGEDPFARPEPELARFRNRVVGFVFQDHHLLPQYTVLENVLLPTLAFPPAAEDAEESARRLLDRVGLAHRLAHRPAELSGGERQRAAVARALIHRPTLLLCDEPTGNLDRTNALSVTDLLLELRRETGSLLIVVTHSDEVADRFERRATLSEGRCVAA